MTAAVVLLTLGGLLLIAWVPSRQPARGLTRHPSAPDGVRRLSRSPSGMPPTAAPGLRRSRLSRWPAAVARRRRARPPDVGAVISEVATRLRSGAPAEHAWSAAVDRALRPEKAPDSGAHLPEPWLSDVPARPPDLPPAGLPPAGLLPADLLPAGLRRLAERCSGDVVAEAAVRSVMAATCLSRTTGAPLADVLDRCVETVVEAERAHDARSVALAGPRSTARILTGLPLLGVLLGAGLGADPVATALDGGWGTLAVAGGVLLLYAGARWSAALVRSAQGPATGSPRPRRPVTGSPRLRRPVSDRDGGRPGRRGAPRRRRVSEGP